MQLILNKIKTEKKTQLRALCNMKIGSILVPRLFYTIFTQMRIQIKEKKGHMEQLYRFRVLQICVFFKRLTKKRRKLKFLSSGLNFFENMLEFVYF